MARRKQIPVRKNFAFLIPLAPYAATALATTGVALTGAIIGTGAYSSYVVAEEKKRQKDLPKISDNLDVLIQRVEQGMEVPDSMPNSVWISPTDDAQAALRVAWLYMLAAAKNPEHKDTLLAEARAELQEYYDLTSWFSDVGIQSYSDPYDPALQAPWLRLETIFDSLGISNMDPYYTGIKNTQDPEEIQSQIFLEQKLAKSLV